jgi:hypothetical protein
MMISTFGKMTQTEVAAPYAGTAAMLVVVMLSCPLLAQEPNVGVPDAHVLAEFKMDGGGDVILVPVTLRSTEWQFMLDTGFSSSAIDVSLRRELGPARGTEELETPLGAIDVSFFDLPAGSRMGSIDFRDEAVVGLIDFEAVRRASGHPVFGVVGMDFLARYVVQLDPDEGKLRIYEKPPPVFAKPVVIEFLKGKPYVRATINAQQTQALLIDTGYYSSASAGLTSETIEKLIGSGSVKASVRESHIATVAGEGRSIRILNIASLGVGGATAFDVEFAETGWDVLGLTFFARFKTTFDFQNGKVYLVPGKRAAERDHPDRSGLHIWKLADDVVVRTVDDDSPAAKASIETGDVLSRINGKTPNNVSLHELRLLFRQQHQAFDITIRRGDQTLPIRLRW